MKINNLKIKLFSKCNYLNSKLIYLVHQKMNTFNGYMKNRYADPTMSNKKYSQVSLIPYYRL